MAYKKIMVALVGREDDEQVIHRAVEITETFVGQLIAVHVNDPHAGEMSMMMDSCGPCLTEEDIRDHVRKYAGEEVAQSIEVQIITDRVIHKALTRASKDMDLLILGHCKMKYFKEKFFDSIDEGIINHVDCPVLVIPKD